MDIIQRLNRLQLHQDFLLHKPVCHIIANHDPVVPNVNSFLLLY
jgi:hypothetical protein